MYTCISEVESDTLPEYSPQFQIVLSDCNFSNSLKATCHATMF